MLFTALFIAILFGLLIAAAVLWAFLLRFGLRWVKAPDITRGRMALATTIVFVSAILLALGSTYVSQFDLIPANVLTLLELGAAILIPIVVIGRVFSLPFAKSFQAWLPTFATPILLLPLVILIIRPFLYQTYTIPTNSMAPTLVGQHWKSVCTECGQPAYGTPIPPGQHWRGAAMRICESNFHLTEPDESDETSGPEFSGDRLVAAKFLKPRRWDLAIFQFPSIPEVMYVKRLVGLPGEEITIRDGRVWADGKLLTPPESIRGIKYITGIEPNTNDQKFWGAPENPAQLADDEYFFLGDFSPAAADSRFWQEGAPGHNPFAVPRSYIRGVVTTIYWPPSRWRAFH